MKRISNREIKIIIRIFFIGLGIASSLLALNHVMPPTARFLWAGEPIFPDLNNISKILHIRHSEAIEYATIIAETTDGETIVVQQNAWQIIDSIPPGNDQKFLFERYPNRIFVEIEENEIYELINSEWLLIALDDKPYHSQGSPCAEWIIFPLIKPLIIDSNGYIFEHALANVYHCYTVSKQGNLILYTKIFSIFHIFWIVPSLIGGVLAGLLCSHFFIRYLNTKSIFSANES